ncbi:MAG: DUF3575 domain-containing protein [Prevotella sp.]|nr:DUF3575 domain-containing protein [Prevotella sp.]
MEIISVKKLRWLMVTVAVLFFGTVQAQFLTDTLSIRFRLDSTRVDLGFADNARAWETFERNFHRHYDGLSPHTLRLDIYSGASPEGTAAHNRWLGENRGLSIRRLVRQNLGNRVGNIIVHNEAARWEGFYEAVAGSSEPWRDEVLRIIELPASADENQWDHREYKLRALHGGRVWPVLLEKYLAPLRSGATAILSWQPGRDTLIVRDTVVMESPGLLPPNLVFEDSTGHLRRLPDSARVRKPVVRRPVWIAKTNVPLLGTGTPNLQLEWSLDHKDRWSLAVEGVWSWWTFAYNAYANEIIYGSLELRRYLGRRYRHHTLDGWHIGLGVGGGYGDLEWRSKGYQGEVYSGFVNIGWQRRFGRRKQWAFDMGIGLGYAYVPWRRYDGSTLFPVGKEEYHDDHLMWQETSRTNWFTATHFNISIGYVFNQPGGKWRREKAMQRHRERNDYLHFRDSMKAHEQFERDSAKIARKQRLKEIDMLPRAERRLALQQLKAEDMQAKFDAKMARRQAKIDAVGQKRQSKIDRLMEKERLRIEKEEYKAHQRMQKLYEKTPEGRAARRQQKIDEKIARRQAKIDARQAKKQAAIDKKSAKIRQRIEFEHRQNLEKLQRDMQRADQKYGGSEK